MRSRIAWMLKQILPLTYRTFYEVEVAKGVRERHFVVWRMWFGRCFAQTDVVVQQGCASRAA